MKRICLIDLSGIFRSAWHASEHEDMSGAYNRTVATVTTSSAGYDHVAICVDRPPYKRKLLYDGYKAHREKAPEAMNEQLRAVIAQLDRDGFHIVGADGYEADDIIAICVEGLRSDDRLIDVYSADKDLLQLVDDGHVAVVSTATRQRYATAEEVKTKLGVAPGLVSSWLALVGDKADDIPGVKGVGPITASSWLNKHGSLEAVLANAATLDPARFREAVAGGAEAIRLSYRLSQLMVDAPINPEVILMDKPKNEETKAAEAVAIPAEEPEMVYTSPTPTTSTSTALVASPVVDESEKQLKKAAANIDQALAPWDKALEPRGPAQAWGIAQALYKSRLFGDFPNPEAILAVVMTGRSLGMDTVASLRGFHLVKGKPSMSAQLIIGIVKRSGMCEFFRLVETNDDHATWETKRRDEPAPTRMTYSMADASRAGLTGNDQWKKRPRTMLQWRAGTELARAVYPDLVSGLYSVEELEDAA